MTVPTFRFAPSPNGYLHLGHAFSAALNFGMAKARGGRFLLRIEDIDRARCRPEYESAIYQDLGWLGLAWETPVRRQSGHFAAYEAALARLEAMDLIYPAFESRAEIARLLEVRGAQWPRDPDGVPLYPGDARQLSAAERKRRIAAGDPYALRLDMTRALTLAATQDGVPLTWTELDPAGDTAIIAAEPAAWGDVILARKDVRTSYHLAVAVDDADQGVTHVVRGHDLFAATSLHRLLQRLLGLPAPAYHHHRLIVDAEGRKLAKSSAATGLRELRAAGATPDEVLRVIGLDIKPS
jgi:glutamyl-Q tRNA(Asp) synthetase